MMVLVLHYPSTYVLEVRQWKLRTNFALCSLLPSLASNLKERWFCSSIMLFSVSSQLLQRKEFAAKVSTKSSKCKLNASCNSAFNASLAPLHTATCSFFLVFFSCPEETEDLHKQQSSIAKIACRLINAPQLIRAVAMNHNQSHADSAEMNCPTSVHPSSIYGPTRPFFRGRGCGYARLYLPQVTCPHQGYMS